MLTSKSSSAWGKESTKSIDTLVNSYVLAFPQDKLDVDVFMDIPLGMGVHVNMG